MKKKILLGLITVTAVSGIAYGASWYSHGRFVETTDNAIIDGDIIAISSKVSGQIDSIAVTDNQRIKAGDTLFHIDDSDLRAAYEERKSAYDAAQAAVIVAKANQTVMANAITEAKAQLKSTQAEHARAQADYRRYSKLNKSQYASKQRFQAARAIAISAKADVDRASATLATQESRYKLSQAERQQAEANAASRLAALDAARIRLSDTHVRAAKNGVIGNIGIRVGQYVTTGQRTMSLVPISDVYITANYKETQVEHMQPGQNVLIEVDAYPNQDFHGIIDSISPGSGSQFSLLPPENATGNFTKIVQRIPVKIRLEQDRAPVLLVPGMSVVTNVDVRSPGTDAVGNLTENSAFVSPAFSAQVAEIGQ